MKKLLSAFLMLLALLALTACGHTHAFGEWQTMKESTCTEKGEQERSCSCGEKETQNLGLLPHTYEKNGNCAACGQNAADHGYTHAVPENQGVQNVIDRAYLLTDVEWTPKADVPGLLGNGKVMTFKAGVTYKGIPYSGVTANDCYVGLNVSLESYLTALENKNSVLYTENLQGTNTKAATYFGTVCSKFVQYALDVPGSYNTNNVAKIPGMDTIAMQGNYTVNEIRLGDVVLDVDRHTTVCTDILYNADGSVAFVEISEATYPCVRRMLWSPEEFYEHFASYRLCRYQYIADTPAPETVALRDSYALMPRLGDKYNYKVSAARAAVDVLESGYYKAVVLRDGTVAEEIILDGKTSFGFDRSVPGNIEMYLEREDGMRSESVYACVVKSSVTVADMSSFSSGKLTVEFDASSGAPVYVQVGTAHAVFCNVEGMAGTAEISFNASKVTAKYVRVAYQNAYGIYISDWTPFLGSENTSDDPLLSQAEYFDGRYLSASQPVLQMQEDKAGYFTYVLIPVAENEIYYSKGANRMWFFDAYGNAISTYNASKESEVKYQFKTPAGAAFVSISYSPSAVEKGTESIEIVHNYTDGVCRGCGKSES